MKKPGAFLVEHDLARKPVSTFRDHAPGAGLPRERERERERTLQRGLVATAEGLTGHIQRAGRGLRRHRDGLRHDVRGRLRVAVLQVSVELRRERGGGTEDEDGGDDGLEQVVSCLFASLREAGLVQSVLDCVDGAYMPEVD